MTVFPEGVYRFIALIKIPMTIFTEIEKSTLKFIWKHKRSQIVKMMLSQKSNAGSITISDFKLCYRTIVTKAACYCHKSRHLYQ
jgi:predicted enzyme involved in methoxymalonyl-ACP biosynthesis